MRAPRTGPRRVMTRLAQAAVTVILLALLWRIADGQDAARILTSADPWWLAAAGVLLLAHTVLAALRWRVTAAPLGVALSRRRAIAEYFLAQLGNTTLPGGVLGDAGRAARSRHDVGIGPAAGAIVIERTVGQVALLSVLAVTFLSTLMVPTSIVWPAPLAAVVGAVLCAVAGIALALVLATTRARGRRDTRYTRALDGVRRSMTSPGVAPAQVAYSAGTTVCILCAFACCATAVGAPLPLVAVGATVPLVLLAMLLPVSIGGWGVREGAAVALLPLAGLTQPQALATSIAFGAVALAAALPGLAAVWLTRDRHSSSPDARPVRRTSLPEEYS